MTQVWKICNYDSYWGNGFPEWLVFSYIVLTITGRDAGENLNNNSRKCLKASPSKSNWCGTVRAGAKSRSSNPASVLFVKNPLFCVFLTPSRSEGLTQDLGAGRCSSNVRWASNDFTQTSSSSSLRHFCCGLLTDYARLTTKRPSCLPSGYVFFPGRKLLTLCLDPDTQYLAAWCVRCVDGCNGCNLGNHTWGQTL